jgi:HSP20 family protein
MRNVLALSPLTSAATPRCAPRAENWTPAVDIIEGEGDFLVRVDVPGYSKEALSISIENNQLEIRGEREKSEDDVQYLRRERRSGAFIRTFRLGRHVDASHVRAAYENGVLEVRIAKAEDAKPRRIEVS